jgi:hypothetical protein
MLTACVRRFALGFAAAIAAATALTGSAALADEPGVRAESPADIKVGAQLEALSDVTLGRAELAKGSKVNVVKVLLRQGHLTSVDVELADGQVTRAPATTVRTYFRVVTD